MTIYCESDLHGLVAPETGHKTLRRLGVTRNQIDRLRDAVLRTGFTGTPLEQRHGRSAPPRWPEVRDYLLTLLGRRDVPATEVDRDDAGPSHP